MGCSFSACNARDGGAINNSSVLALTRCTLSGNTASRFGGAISGLPTTLTHCTISGNSAGREGGGVKQFVNNWTINFTIIAGNTATDVFSLNFGGFFSGAFNILSGNPLLGALASNGGPTKTMALLAGSPAINAATGSTSTSDQRGLAVVGTADIGAYENQQLTQTITFNPLTDRAYGSAPFAVNATSNSGQTVSFQITEGYAGTAAFDNGSAGGSAGQNLVLNGAGHVTITASAAATGDYAAATPVEQGFTVLSIMAGWRATNFGGATAEIGDAEDFDHDGVANLLEFAFGTNPNGSGSGSGVLQYTGSFAGSGTIAGTGQPITRVESITNGVDFRAVFVRRKDFASAGLTYTPQFSANLTTWQDSATTPSVLADDGTNQIVSVPYPVFIAGKKARFFRISVNIAP